MMREKYATHTRQRKEESPEYVQVSLAAAMTLGLRSGVFYRDAKLYCVNLLLTYDDGCKGACAYCGLSRLRGKRSSIKGKTFIRVDWPTYRLDEVTGRLSGAEYVKRVCVSMVTHPKAYQDLCVVVSKVKASRNILVSALITPTLLGGKEYYNLKDLGVDRVGIAVDAATEDLFDFFRGGGVAGPHQWSTYWDGVSEAVSVFGRYMVGVHLIVGLGETEEQMISTIQKAYDTGALTHLFSFYPEFGSQAEGRQQSPIGQYVRIQLARYLINNNLSSVGRMTFNDRGQVTNFGLDGKELDEVIWSGLPFMTSGCVDDNGFVACNRPYANSTPRQALDGKLRNYPFPPEESDILNVLHQLKEF